MKFSKLTPFHWFFVKAISLYLIWLVVFYYWGQPRGGFDDKMTELVGESVVWVTRTMGYQTDAVWKEAKGNDWYDEARIQLHLSVDGNDTVRIDNRCNGLFTLLVYIGFIACYPGKWLAKTLFIALGGTLIFLSNIIRVLVLVYNWIYFQASFEFNHKYTYTLLLYSIVFLLWMWWVNKYSDALSVSSNAS